jgi:hypothetical protein
MTSSDGADASYTLHFGKFVHTPVGTFGSVNPKHTKARLRAEVTKRLAENAFAIGDEGRGCDCRGIAGAVGTYG